MGLAWKVNLGELGNSIAWWLNISPWQVRGERGADQPPSRPASDLLTSCAPQNIAPAGHGSALHSA